MGLLEQQKLDRAQTAFSTRFNGVLVGVDDPARAVSMAIPSTTDTEEHDWLNAAPALTEWVDERKIGKRRLEQIRITNKEYANGIRLKRNDIVNDRIGVIGTQVDDLAQKAGLHYGDLIVQALIAGFTLDGDFGNAYDGKAFFAADHEDEAEGAQSNLSAGTALSQVAYDAARAVMQSLFDIASDPLGIRPNFLIVGPTNERLALEITQSNVIAGPAGESITNVFRGTASVIISPRLVGADAGKWFLADLSRAVRPLILQIREAITTAMLPASGSPSDFSNSERLFMKKDLLFGAQGQHAVGFALWQFIHGGKP